jgi:diguanylate cyclase (GGDEF)-like protein
VGGFVDTACRFEPGSTGAYIPIKVQPFGLHAAGRDVEAMGMKLLRGHRQSRAARRRFPLMLTFTAVSLVLTLAVGIVLAAQIQRLVARRSLQSLTETTQSAVAITMNTIVSGLSYGQSGVPLTNAQREAQVDVISSAARVLIANSQSVLVVGALVDGTVIGGAGGAPVIGTKVPLDADFRAALAGHTQVRTVRSDTANAASAVERSLLRRYGSVLQFQQGVRLKPGGPVVGVVRSYAPLGPTDRQAAADARSIVWLLALGLLLFWAALFRLVWGASRTMKRQSKAHIHLATHDPLTGLPNRTLLRERTDRAIVAAGSTSRMALILMDLDRFKEVNDTFGHHHGDLLLQQIGARLEKHVSESDTVARIGGDEFVVLLPGIASPGAAVAIAHKLNVALQEPFLLDGVMVDVACSTGVVTTPEDGADFDELLQHADIAMYAAKKDCLGVLAYSHSLDSYSPTRLTLLADLRNAVESQEHIVLHYQPLMDLTGGRIVGVEALARWQHPEHGLLSPDRFIPLAEHTGIIRPLTWLILRTALEQNRQWADQGLLLRVSVNLSARCLLDSGFCDRLVQLLAETGVPAERLELELTESAIMSDPDHAMRILEDLAANGVGLSIDDFGTGYSSMAYLKRLPVTEIKIDRAFITHMDTDESDAAIVRTCLDLARNLNLAVVAEGVETVEVRQLLSDLGCDTIQGYLLSRPMSASHVAGWLRGYTSSVPLPRGSRAFVDAPPS